MALTPAQKQQAYRDRKQAARNAMLAEVERQATLLLRQELAASTSRWALALEIERREREALEAAAIEAEEAQHRAEAARVQAGIAYGSVHPSGRPWRDGEPIKRPNQPTSPREMMEAGRRAALQGAVDSFDRTGALAVDPDGPRSRRESPFAGRIRYDWHRDY